ncbi:MAG: SpoIIE family protein phosphatase [Calditrichaeota bacterium]|nr:SpoIIE family protein phosphatase [Calditrichota bacterium]
MSLTFILSTTFLIVGAIIFILAVIVFRENPKSRLHRVTGFMLLFAALGTLLVSFAPLFPRENVNSWNQFFLFRFAMIWEFFFPYLFYFSLNFPRQSAIFKKHPALPFYIFTPYFLRFFFVLFFPDYEVLRAFFLFDSGTGVLGSLLRPVVLAMTSLVSVLGVFYRYHFIIFSVLNTFCVLAAMITMFVGYQKVSERSLRKQVGFVLWGISISAVIYAVSFLVTQTTPMRIRFDLSYTLTLLAVISLTFAVGWAIVKYHFLSTRIVIRRGLVFSIATGMLVGVFLLLYGQTKKIFSSFIQTDTPVFEIIFLLIAVFFLQPMLDLLNAMLDKIFRPQQKNTLMQLSKDILSTFDIKKLQTKIISALEENLRAKPIHLLIPDDNGLFLNISDASQILRPVKFSPDGEFITVLTSHSRPVRADKIRVMISDEKELQFMDNLKPFLIVPLKYQDRLIGIVSIGPRTDNRMFSSADLEMMEIFCLQVAIALENSRLYEIARLQRHFQEELVVAGRIQRMLLPLDVPEGQTFQIASLNIPSKEVGGDYHDFIRLDNSLLGIAIGDISGKGIPGSILMSNLQASLRATAPYSQSASQVVRDVNRHLTRTTAPEKYATFLYAIFDEKTRLFRFCNAGHNYPILHKSSGECNFIKLGDPIIGIDEHLDFHDHELQLSPDDLIVLYTDGITEALNAQSMEYGEDRLYEVISTSSHKDAQEIKNKIYDEVISFTQGTDQYDDITLIVLKVV